MIPVRPQPVLDAAKIGGLVQGALVALGGVVLVFFPQVTGAKVSALAAAVGLATTAVIALVVYVAAIVHAKAGAAQVTPLSSPQDDQGRALVPVDEYGRHSALPSGASIAINASGVGERVDSFEDVRELAAGVHGHPSKKLGKLPPIPGRAAVPFGQFVSTVPAHPIADPAPPLVYPMDRNDQVGDCVVAGLDHTLQTICAALGVPRPNWSDAELLAFYRTQNADFRSWADGGTAADRGMVIQTFLEYLVAQGVILAFGKIDHTSPDEMRAATYLGLAIVTGELLQTAQQTQQVWDYKKSGVWGGHCTCTVGYPGATRQTCVSWGAEVDMTEAFIAHQLDEAWFVLIQAHVDHPGFRAGFDLAGFAAAVSEMTGGKVVVPVPAPTPPTPAPGAPPAAVVAWARHTLTLKGQSHGTLAVAHWILASAGVTS